MLQLFFSCKGGENYTLGGRVDKQKNRLKSIPKDYTYSEAKSLLCSLDFEETNKGRTSGSRVMFYRKRDMVKIMLHKPHPGDKMCVAAVRELSKKLIETGDIYE